MRPPTTADPSVHTTDDAPIVAVSSPPGRSVRGMIRISGAGLGPFLESVLDPPPTPRELSTARLKWTGMPVLVLYRPGPNSYTGQDTLELQLPGNPALLDRVMHGLLDALRRARPDSGARVAEAGEFTRRAFTAGRIDLTMAEGIAATIGATSDAQLRAAAHLRTGELGRWATGVVDTLAQALALVEAGIDFTDQDDVVPITPGSLDAQLGNVEREVRGLSGRARSWSALDALPWVVLAGAPNAGKSTLFNALLGRERVVISDVAGTTRDVIAEPLRFSTGAEESEVMLVDIAGLDDAAGLLNPAMQAAARAALERADLVLRVRAADAADDPPFAPPDGAAVIDVRTKSDLAHGATPASGALAVSAVTGEGMDALRRAVAAAVRDRAVSLSGEMFALRPRHRAELDTALDELAAARGLLADQRDDPALSDPELIADRMRAALDALGALGGALTPDDVIGKVFATFCVGK